MDHIVLRALGTSYNDLIIRGFTVYPTQVGVEQNFDVYYHDSGVCASRAPSVNPPIMSTFICFKEFLELYFGQQDTLHRFISDANHKI